MAFGVQHLDQRATPAGMNGVYLIALQDIDLDALPALIGERPITAVAPHPRDPDLLYVTTQHPESLAFLPDPYVDLRP